MFPRGAFISSIADEIDEIFIDLILFQENFSVLKSSWLRPCLSASHQGSETTKSLEKMENEGVYHGSISFFLKVPGRK